MQPGPPEPKGKLGAADGHHGGRLLPGDGERTGGRAPPAWDGPLTGRPRGGSTAAAAADLQGGAGAGLAQGQEPAEADAAEPVEHAGQRAAGDAAQCRAQDRGDRRGGRLDLHGQGGVAVRVHRSLSSWQPVAVRRVYIPKASNRAKLRPLGIPVIVDRCHQARVRTALEPEWEARFEPRSYGFRPGRGCHDAIEAIYAVCKGPRSKRVWFSTLTWRRRSTRSTIPGC